MQIHLNSDRYLLRYYLAIAGLSLLFIPIIFRLYDLQVTRAESLRQIANRQHSLIIDIEPERGEILDRKGKPLATSLKVPSLYAIPRLIRQEERSLLAQRLSHVLGIPSNEILQKLQKDKAFVWLKRRVSNTEVDQVLAFNSPHIGILFETKRFYPSSEIFSNLLGVCNVDDQGIEGLELWYNKYLVGRKGHKITKRDAMGREIVALEEEMIPPVNGYQLILTIDEYLQYIVERELRKAYEKWQAKGASCVVLEPHSGKILAMVSLPHFNANYLDQRFEQGKRQRAVVDFYEPGSIFKIVTAAAALNEGLFKESDTIFCENGEYNFLKRRVLHDVHPYGDLSFAEVVIKSSNIGTVKIAEKLGAEKLYAYIKRFGFGELTEIDFPGEVSGIIRPVSQWSGYSISSIPMGQEVTVTALQMVRAMSVIANGGVLMRPYIVSRVVDQKGIAVRQHNPVTIHRVVEKETADRIKNILKEVVVSGTGKAAQIEGISVAGKTGTAQKILSNGRGYSHSDFIASFVGFAPVEEPLLAINVMVDEPKPVYYGGAVAAPVFREVVKEALSYLQYVRPDAGT